MMKQLLEMIEQYPCATAQEETDKQNILTACQMFGDSLFTRENPFLHITSSALVCSPTLRKTLMVRHHIYRAWCWPGGHADGEHNLLAAAQKEAQEECGILSCEPLSKKIFSLDILSVPAHVKNGTAVSAHVHLSFGFCLIADESQPLRHAPSENSGTAWVDCEELEKICGEPRMMPIYRRILSRAKEELQ